MKKKCKVFEQVKSEISKEKTKALLAELEDELQRMADRVDIDEDEGEIKIQGLKGKLCQISGTLHISDKKDKYIFEGEIEGKADTMYWGIWAAGMVLLLISIFAFWPLLLISIAISLVIFFMLSGSVTNMGKTLGNKFRDALKNI